MKMKSKQWFFMKEQWNNDVEDASELSERKNSELSHINRSHVDDVALSQSLNYWITKLPLMRAKLEFREA